jgi:hypothetical protein
MLKSYALWGFPPSLSRELCWEEKGLRGKDFGKESSIKTGLSLAANFDSPNRLIDSLIAVFPLEAGRVLAILELTSTLGFLSTTLSLGFFWIYFFLLAQPLFL